MRSRPVFVALLAVLLGAGALAFGLAPVVPGAGAVTKPACGTKDSPETGIQGDVSLTDQLSGRAKKGYSCGLALVGYTSLGGRGQNGNMAWSGTCAYIAGDGVAVVDVSLPTRPKQVGTLHSPGAEDSLETVAAVDAPGRHLLAAGRYGLFLDFQGDTTPPVDIYDVADCRHPKLLTTIAVPTGVHNLTFSPDGKRLWTTLPLQSFNVTDPKHPVYEGNLQTALQGVGVNQLEYAHEAMPSTDGTYLYIGGQVVGDEQSYTLDVRGWPKQAPKVVASYAGPGHSIRPATIGGKRYLVRSEESVVDLTANSCVPSAATPAGGVAQAFMTDISNPAAPHDLGTLGLAINEPAHCGDAIASGINTSSHYQDVDDPAKTTFAMVSMWNAGLRVFDVRNPASPREVAYFNPGQFGSQLGKNAPTYLDTALNIFGTRGLDQAWAHSRYVPGTGQIWLTTRTGGFWVLEIEPQVRSFLGLPTRPTHYPQGAPVRPAASLAVTASIVDPTPALYCTLGKI